MNITHYLNDPLQLAAMGILATVFISALYGCNKESGFLAHIARMAPNLLTSIGIFFTFLGIFIALSNVSQDTIDESFPQLIGGLQLAFLSSVSGLLLSIIFKGIQAIVAGKKEIKAGEPTIRDIVKELQELNKNTLQVKESLTGEGDASLATILIKLRADFKDFADKMREDSVGSIVKALEEVVRDFNQKISEQFGENFKQLNQAVGALLEWQQQHKEQVEKLTNAFEVTASGISDIESKTSKIPEQMTAMDTIMKTLQSNLEQLYKGLESLSEMRDSAQSAIPELQQAIARMSSGIQELIDRQLKNSEQHLSDMKEAQSQIAKDTRELQNQIQKSISENSEVVTKVDKEMEQQIQRALDKMGRNLTSITEKLVSTYESHASAIKEAIVRLKRE